ncbi:MAG: hypothetical protein LCH39_11515, partial [Proteobacteria bacterium]|nr:hypothetical protein [Pseudomonadota bacterium]
MTRPVFRSFTFAAIAALALGVGGLHAEDKVAAKVNGEAITDKDIEIALPDVLAEYPNLDAKQQR